MAEDEVGDAPDDEGLHPVPISTAEEEQPGDADQHPGDKPEAVRVAAVRAAAG